MRILVTLGLLIVLIGSGFFLLREQQNKASQTQPLVSVKDSVLKPSPSPSPIPFEDLTITYLRNKDYKSNLGGLEIYENYGSYISYLTNYTSDGLKINGLLTIPKEVKPKEGFPAIIFIHGYIPPVSYKTTEKYIDHVNFLARNGFVVFKIDLRGHGDSEGESRGAYYSSDYIVDVLNAKAALESSDFVNPSKIGIWGHSMAGNVVLRSIAADPSIPAVSIWAGAGFTYVDLAKYGIDDGSYRPPANETARQRRRQLLRDTYGDPVDGNPFWKLVSPVDYLKDYKGSIQLNHAINDDVVNIGYSRDLIKILGSLAISNELNEFPNGGHNISNPSFTPAIEKTVEFFNRYLK